MVGNANSGTKSEKQWRDAIRWAGHEFRPDPRGDGVGRIRALKLLARRLFDSAIEGDTWAITEIGNRLDGANQLPNAESGARLVIELVDPTKPPTIDVTPEKPRIEKSSGGES